VGQRQLRDVCDGAICDARLDERNVKVMSCGAREEPEVGMFSSSHS